MLVSGRHSADWPAHDCEINHNSYKLLLLLLLLLLPLLVVASVGLGQPECGFRSLVSCLPPSILSSLLLSQRACNVVPYISCGLLVASGRLQAVCCANVTLGRRPAPRHGARLGSQVGAPGWLAGWLAGRARRKDDGGRLARRRSGREPAREGEHLLRPRPARASAGRQ